VDSKLTYYNDIESRKVDWLWYPYIPLGKITIIQGDPGEGKTTFVLSLLSILSNGEKLPCSESRISGKAIYQNTEDDNADTIKPRLEKHGANCANICFIEKAGGLLSLDDEDLKQWVIESGAKVLVLDPIQAFIGENIDMNRANAVRPRMNKLKELAESTGCAVLLVGHLNKNAGGKSSYRGLGSIDFSAAARSILVIGKSPDDENIRVLAHQKSNLGPIGESLGFTLVDGRVEWIGKYDVTADELMSGTGAEKRKNKHEDATELLLSLLSTGPKPYSEIMEIAESEGIGNRTMVRAKGGLKVVSTKIANEWYWSLPDE
jgi:hypothetical protein